jgi:iron-sulfur cluster assembly protein
MVPPVEISPEALERVKERLAQCAGGSLRLGIRGGGCSGFSYVLQFDDGEPTARDVSWELDGTRVIVDRKSLLYLSGSRLAWKKTLMSTGFEFENPHEASRCGCGHSFNVK